MDEARGGKLTEKADTYRIWTPPVYLDPAWTKGRPVKTFETEIIKPASKEFADRLYLCNNLMGSSPKGKRAVWNNPSGALVAILNNLGLIFCTGIAIELAKKKKAEAGFTALLAFLVFINAMNKFMGLRGMLVDADALRGSGQAVVLGIQILDMGVFLGIILGCVSAYVHNRFIDTEFNNAFQIYGVQDLYLLY